jgi:hypothetical protein
MVIYLRHPVHGTKVAVAEVEALADEKHGWVRYTLASTDSLSRAATLTEIVAPQPQQQRRRRRATEVAL